MTKTKIGVVIHKNGSETDVILRMVGNVNGGNANIGANDLVGYLNTRNAMFPSINHFSYKVEWPFFHVSEDKGETFTLTLEWKEVEELTEEQGDGPAGVSDDFGPDDIKTVL